MPKFMAGVVETDICIVGISKAPSWKTQKRNCDFTKVGQDLTFDDVQNR